MKKAKNKILITEDEIAILRAITDKLTMEKFEVLEAQNGEEGLKIALREHPDLILLDIIMPRMDGLTMLKKLREDKWGNKVPIILLTNLNNERKTLEIIKSGACDRCDYLIKSNWKLNDVVAKVREKLEL
jgi:DNA-binding response OmpR family regulator